MRRRFALTALLGALLLSTAATPAHATKFARPFYPNVRTNAGYDNNGGGGGCTDHDCGDLCYDGHTGTDFNVGIGTDVLAGASGTVTQAVMGCPDIGYYCSPCGGNCGNHVRIAHDDGSSSLYCHMRDGSLAVGVGQHVGCREKIGESASSGCSTGPHLHFGWIPGRTLDPFSGGCSNGGGAWVDQGPYGGSPSDQCEDVCECNPGDVQRDGCGRCGTHTRTCGGNCHWDGWSACEGEGPCSPGQTESQGCCDCGSQTRGCGGNCQWGDWGACGGPDPAGSPPCPTGVPGDCATGALRCVTGCITCVQTVFPQPELCDDHDNDCDGPTDEEAPELGDPPARFAAQLEDLSAPEALLPGETAQVWAVFRNVGTQPWPAHSSFVQASTADAAQSSLGDATLWPAYDVPFSVEQPVAPGETTTVLFPIHMPLTWDASGPETRFDLFVAGTPIHCPEPGFNLSPVQLAEGAGPLGAVDGAIFVPESDAGPASGSVPDGGGAKVATPKKNATGCVAAPGQTQGPWLPVLVALPWAVSVRRRTGCPRPKS